MDILVLSSDFMEYLKIDCLIHAWISVFQEKLFTRFNCKMHKLINLFFAIVYSFYYSSGFNSMIILIKDNTEFVDSALSVKSELDNEKKRNYMIDSLHPCIS